MLAVVAGEGRLPVLLLDHLDDQKTPYRLCELEGHAFEARAGRPIIRFRIEALGSFIADLKSKDVSRICFAGHVGRPRLDPTKIDTATMPLVPRMMAALQSGDDAALRLVLGFFAEAGIEPVGVHDLRPDLLPKGGALGTHAPSEQHLKDAARGIEIIAAMAAADVGQSWIVADGQALAIEAQPGTDWMMQSLLHERLNLPGKLTLAMLKPSTGATRAKGLPKGGILVKAAKPGQDLRVDMPVIGLDTINRAAQVGLEGIVIEAGRVMVLDAPAVAAQADRLGLFVMALE